jgi:hypothetical protein
MQYAGHQDTFFENAEFLLDDESALVHLCTETSPIAITKPKHTQGCEQLLEVARGRLRLPDTEDTVSQCCHQFYSKSLA